MVYELRKQLSERGQRNWLEMHLLSIQREQAVHGLRFLFISKCCVSSGHLTWEFAGQ